MEYKFKSQRPNGDLPELMAILQARQGQQSGTGWYKIENRGAEAEIFIYDEIGFFGVTASDFVRELNDLSASRISLRINSPGGDVFDGVTIYNALKRQDAEVNVFVDGIAASAASFIAMAGDTVTMSPHSQMMIHDAQGLAIGPADEMRKMADILDKSSDNIAAIYAERAGGTVEEWRARMVDELWLSDAEAVSLGLADGIAGATDDGTNRSVTFGLNFPAFDAAAMSHVHHDGNGEIHAHADGDLDHDHDQSGQDEPPEPEKPDYDALFERLKRARHDDLFGPQQKVEVSSNA